MNVLPPELITSLQNVPGFDETAFKNVHESGEQITSIRINPAKAFDPESHFTSVEKIPWSSSGYYLKNRPSFTSDPLFHAGTYYVQEASSMFLEEVIRQTCDLTQSLKVLDLCASPGGKSTLVQSIISSDSLLVSNEVIKTRVNALVNNITKWGGANVIVTNNDAKDFQRLPAFFDVIIVDAPCSGSGLFRKNNEAISEWSINNVELCSQRQQRILADVLPALKEGGTLIYSTCSYSEKEDENIADILSGEFDVSSIRVSVKNDSGITETKSPLQNCFGYRFYPDKLKGEGFFIAVFRKNGILSSPLSTKKIKDIKIKSSEAEIIFPWLKNGEKYSFIKQNENILAIPEPLLRDLYEIQRTLYIKKAGVELGTLIRDELIPSHDVAVSNLLSDKIQALHVTMQTALDYLRKKDIAIAVAQKGWATINYAGHALGLIKILPGRANNYYPKELRILNK